MFQEVVRICEFHKPKVIFCENVKGLIIHDKGRTFKVIKKAFEQIKEEKPDIILVGGDMTKDSEKINHEYVACKLNELKEELANELVDVIHYAFAIASLNNIDLNEMIIEKDKKASIKYNHKINLEQFIKRK